MICINIFVLLIIFCANVEAYIYHPNNVKLLQKLNRLSAVLEINSAESLDKVVKSAENTLVVIDYSTTWCGPCKVAAPKFFDLSEKYTDVIFLKCIGDKTPEASQLMKREGVRSVPAFHFWKSGNRFEIVNGARIDDVESLLKEHK